MLHPISPVYNIAQRLSFYCVADRMWHLVGYILIGSRRRSLRCRCLVLYMTWILRITYAFNPVFYILLHSYT